MTKQIISAATTVGFMSLAFVALPVFASGGAWSTVDVNQQQTVTGLSKNLHMEQNAETLTTVRLGNQAAGISHQVGSQTQAGKWAKGTQAQDLHSGVDVTWEKNKWPSWTAVNTTGSVDQEQSIWAEKQILSEQHALNEQSSRVGKGKHATRSTLESEAHQKTTHGTDDIHQRQGISGGTHAEGYTEPHFPKKSKFKAFGGTIRQFVNVTVENILSF